MPGRVFILVSVSNIPQLVLKLEKLLIIWASIASLPLLPHPIERLKITLMIFLFRL